jgi:hypothetical protein
MAKRSLENGCKQVFPTFRFHSAHPVAVGTQPMMTFTFLMEFAGGGASASAGLPEHILYDNSHVMDMVFLKQLH